MEQQIGVWIDSKKANIVTLKGEEATINTIHSGIEGKNRIDGEGKDFARFGEQFVSNENKLENKYKQELASFLNEVLAIVKDAEDVVLFGPAQVKKELEKLMKKDRLASKKLIDVVDADSMTDNQTIAWVKKYFKVGSK